MWVSKYPAKGTHTRPKDGGSKANRYFTRTSLSVFSVGTVPPCCVDTISSQSGNDNCSDCKKTNQANLIQQGTNKFETLNHGRINSLAEHYKSMAKCSRIDLT